ncbi:MAG: hypothetical protein DSZ01_05250, partial [Gammaproteobacteria bacterium]
FKNGVLPLILPEEQVRDLVDSLQKELASLGQDLLSLSLTWIPSLIAHRYLTGKVDELAIAMEEQAIKMVEVLHGEREQ